MSSFLRSLTLVAMTCAAGWLGPMVAATAAHASPATTKAVSFPAPQPAARIWYRAGHYPQLSLPDGRHEIVRSLLNITRPMHFGSFVWNEDRIPNGHVWVRVDLTRQLLSVFRGGHEIGSAVILFGGNSNATPTGSFTILAKDKNYFSHSYNAPMPYALRLTNDGIAIHGSNVRPGWATHGCIGVPLDFARLLFDATSKGDVVVVLPAQEAPERLGAPSHKI